MIEQQVNYTPETVVSIEQRAGWENNKTVVTAEWEVGATDERIVVELDRERFCVWYKSTAAGPDGRYNMPIPAFSAAAYIRVFNALTGDEYRLYMAADDSELLAFDNSDTMAALRDISKHKVLYVVVKTDIYDCSDAVKSIVGFNPDDEYIAGAAVVKKFKEKHEPISSDTLINCIRREFLQVDLMDAFTQQSVKKIYPFAADGESELSAAI